LLKYSSFSYKSADLSNTGRGGFRKRFVKQSMIEKKTSRTTKRVFQLCEPIK